MQEATRGIRQCVSKEKTFGSERVESRLHQRVLGLSDEESAYIELKIRLAVGLRQRRQKEGLSQLDLAAKLQSSQSRVAKMEADPSVSLDLLIRSLLSLGASERELSQIITTPRAARHESRKRGSASFLD